MDEKDEQLRRIAENVAKALEWGARRKLEQKKQAAKEELFRNSLGIRLKKPDATNAGGQENSDSI